ncbi:DUF3592 domain-containing protein [Thiorhodococcus minor]|uniref:DUF3592 domain-containing protein n=1 Tax=Thiorhodococcus minor TaxID=57489 RepID=A0A6M0K517_9GAMM|nr:DUF3592 domain-containing protein [Thiorhodococcus minor]NEV64013.1 DUF3592 domain-containing protein [Thiorhodococcus minor]
MSIKKVLAAIAMTIAWLAVVLLGALFTAAGLHGVKNASTHYTPVTATVIVSKPDSRRGNVNTSSRDLWSSSVDIQYAYAINGARLHGRDRLAIGRDGSPSEASARAAAASDLYAPGNPVQIFVDPEDPSKSTLERETALSGMAVLMVGMIFLAVTLGWGLFSLSKLVRRIFVTTPMAAATERRFQKGMNRALLILLGAMMASALAWGATRAPVTVAIIVGVVILSAGWIRWSKGRALRLTQGRSSRP